MHRFLNILSGASSVAALLAAIWIVVPAPSQYIWLFAVAASEWSLWLAALALAAIICALLDGIFYADGKFWIAPLVVGVAAFAVAVYPLASVWNLARANDVALSFKDYFAGLHDSFRVNKDGFKTYTFARIDGEDLHLDVYAPTRDTANSGAAVVVVHGGSWNGGARNDFPQWNEWLAGEGFTVFDVDYRLAPQPNYLAATSDVKCAVGWIKSQAAKFDIAPERIALLGRSAGGHLALLAAYTAGDEHLPPSCQSAENDANVRAVAALYAPTDLNWAYDHPANQSVIDGPATLAAFLGGSPHDSPEMNGRYESFSPVARVSANMPPTLLIHGGRDQLVRLENMNRLGDELNRAGVNHQTIYIPYAQHGFDYNFHGFGAQIIRPALLEFLRANTAAR